MNIQRLNDEERRVGVPNLKWVDPVLTLANLWDDVSIRQVII
jgi:hypothetical protein